MLAIALCWTLYGGFVFGVAGVGLGVAAMRRPAEDRGTAVTGSICGGLGLIATTALLISHLSFGSVGRPDDLNRYNSCITGSTTAHQREQCAARFLPS